MKILARLTSEAMESATWRGHEMEWQAPIKRSYGRTIQTAVCKWCGMWAQVDTKPEPNGIDVGGTAVALNCTHEGEGQ